MCSNRSWLKHKPFLHSRCWVPATCLLVPTSHARLLLWKLVPNHFAPSFILSLDHGCPIHAFLCIRVEISPYCKVSLFACYKQITAFVL